MSKSDTLKEIEEAMSEVDIEDLLDSLGEKLSSDLKNHFSDSSDQMPLDYFELKPYGLMSGHSVGNPVFIFKDLEEERNFPIRMGNLQTSVVALGLGPNLGSSIFGFTRKVLKACNVNVNKVVFDHFKDNLLMAKFEMEYGDETHVLVSSAEEILSLALELNADFFTTEDVFVKLKSMELDKDGLDSEIAHSIDQDKSGQRYLM